MTKTYALLALGVAAAFASPALAQEPLSLRVLPPGLGTPSEATVNTPTFRAAALQSDAVSIESSRMALERSRDPRVRSYARNVITTRQATTDALLPPGTSLTASGTVVSDSQGIPTRFDNPVGVVLAPVTVAANVATSVVGGVLGGVGIVDNRPNEPGRRVALGAGGQARIDRLRAAQTSRGFDRAYVNQQAQSDANTLALYEGYSRAGDSAQGRKFADEALPYIADEHARSANLDTRYGG